MSDDYTELREAAVRDLRRAARTGGVFQRGPENAARLADAIDALAERQIPDGWERTPGTGGEPCDRCNNGNLVWWVESEQWNVAVPERSPILCPACFAVAWEAATNKQVIWELRLDPNSAALVPVPSPDTEERQTGMMREWDPTIIEVDTEESTDGE